MKFGISFNSVLKRKVGSGMDTFFWLDDWTGHGVFKEKFPGLYSIENRKTCKVNHRFDPLGVSWNWKNTSYSNHFALELNEINCCIGDFRPSGDPDSWSSDFVYNEQFSVAAIRDLIDKPVSPSPSSSVLWVNEVPKKVMCFVWRAYLGRVPSAEGLIKRGVHLSSSICSRCRDGIETVEHIFIHCPCSREILDQVWSWCGLGLFSFSSLHDLIVYVANWGNSSKARRVLATICYGAIWLIWKARNALIFDNKVIPANTVTGDIQSTVFSWIQWRSRNIKLIWESWLCNPISSCIL